MSERERKSSRSARPPVEACRDLVLSSPGATPADQATPLRSNERETSPALRLWVRRYVAALAEADTAARVNDGAEEPEDP